MKNPIGLLRITGLVEGVSFLVLLGIAMPLKYAWGMPQAVRIVGMIHGILFIAFGLALVRATRAARWSLGRTAMIFVGALLPFGPWFLDSRIRRFEEEYLQRATSA